MVTTFSKWNKLSVYCNYIYDLQFWSTWSQMETQIFNERIFKPPILVNWKSPCFLLICVNAIPSHTLVILS